MELEVVLIGEVADDRKTPVSTVDIFNPSVLTDPWPTYRDLRRTGPIVYLSQAGAYALTRYSTIHWALRNPHHFRNGEGVAFNDAMNAKQKLTILGSDPPEHGTLRTVLTPLLSTRALDRHRARMMAAAAELVGKLVDKGPIDAVRALAQHLPVTVGLDILGLPESNRRRHLMSADMNFNAFGPITPAILADLQRLDAYIGKMDEFAAHLESGSIGYEIMQAAKIGQITREQALGLLQSLILGALDTTARSLTTAIYYFATHPAAWDLIRGDPSLIPNAYNEILRLDGPSLAISRVAAKDVAIGEQLIPAGARVVLLLASANRDELRWDRPDELDIYRADAKDMLTFGHGIHFCIGTALARLQSHALLTALADHVARITLVGEPRRRLSSVVRGFEHLTAILHGA